MTRCLMLGQFLRRFFIKYLVPIATAGVLALYRGETTVPLPSVASPPMNLVHAASHKPNSLMVQNVERPLRATPSNRIESSPRIT